jgi:hypothetical protein
VHLLHTADPPARDPVRTVSPLKPGSDCPILNRPHFVPEEFHSGIQLDTAKTGSPQDPRGGRHHRGAGTGPHPAGDERFAISEVTDPNKIVKTRT